MMRTAVAARTLPLVLVMLAATCFLAQLPSQALAQEPQGAGAAPLSTAQPQATQRTDPQPAPQPMQESNSPRPPKAKAKTPAAAQTPTANATLAQLAWLAGRWQGDWGPRAAQQVWMPPQAGVMVGVFQLTENTQTLVVELYTIVATPEGIQLRVRHFTPSLAAWETAGPSLLKLTTYDSKSYRFVNEDNGQPKQWLMKRIDLNTYLAHFDIVPEKGQEQTAEILYHRQSAMPPVSH